MIEVRPRQTVPEIIFFGDEGLPFVVKYSDSVVFVHKGLSVKK